jgi:3alpha(or 20beta)-hydroxysteroid dehydrogenase
VRDRVVLVTGGARGIGEATARLLVAEGACVIIGDVREELGAQVAAELGTSACFCRLDVASEVDWDVAVAAARDRFGKLDGLVNNAGIFEWRPLKGHSLDAYMRCISVNQVGVFLGMRAAVPALEQAGGGTIVNVSSVAGLIGTAGAVAYTASKFAVTGMSKAAALELRSLGIRVNSVHPGVVKTPLTLGTAEEAATMSNIVGGAEPKAIADLILYLTSDESSFSTGAAFVADGGDMAGTVVDFGAAG